MPKDLPSASEELWLQAAYEVLCESGVDAVKVMPLAKRLGMTRTGFYWYFKDRAALLEAMIQRWEARNTGNLVARTESYATSISEGIFNLFDCWIDGALFDPDLDTAIRSWARTDASLKARVDEADATRMAAIAAMFRRFDYPPAEAEVRARSILYTQIGYIAMQITESWPDRIARMPDYAAVFTGQTPSAAEIARFRARHAVALGADPA